MLNAHATFWNTALHGLQTASFMALSCLFDQGPNVHSMERFLGHTVAHPEFFTREAFDRRKSLHLKEGLPLLHNWMEANAETAGVDLGELVDRETSDE